MARNERVRALHDGKMVGGMDRRTVREGESQSGSQNGGQARARDHIVRENSIILHDVATLYINSRLILRTRVRVVV